MEGFHWLVRLGLTSCKTVWPLRGGSSTGWVFELVLSWGACTDPGDGNLKTGAYDGLLKKLHGLKYRMGSSILQCRPRLERGTLILVQAAQVARAELQECTMQAAAKIGSSGAGCRVNVQGCVWAGQVGVRQAEQAAATPRAAVAAAA